jgi:hypothetical protein
MTFSGRSRHPEMFKPIKYDVIRDFKMGMCYDFWPLPPSISINSTFFKIEKVPFLKCYFSYGNAILKKGHVQKPSKFVFRTGEGLGYLKMTLYLCGNFLGINVQIG